MFKKVLSVLLAVIMLATTVSAMSISAYAQNTVNGGIDNIIGDDEETDEDIAGIENSVSKFDESNVTSADSNTLAEIKNTVNAYLTSDAAELTDAQKAKLEAVLSKVQKLEDKISAVSKAVEDACKAADSIGTVNDANIETAKKAVADIDALLSSGNLTEAERTALEAKKAKLNNDIANYKPATPGVPAPSTPSVPSTPSAPSAPAPSVNPTIDVGDVNNNKKALALNSALKVTNTGKKIGVKWGKVSGADGYLVYVQYCGKKFSKKATKTVTSAKKTSVTIKKLNGKALNTKKNYKVYVVAYQNVNGKKVTIGKTITAHVVGAKNKKYTNVKKVTVSKSKYTLKKGKSAKIKAKTVLVDSKKKPLSNKHATKFRYKSSNTKVAKVNSKGKITAVRKGKCKVYVYARNGCTRTITVTVK